MSEFWLYFNLGLQHVFDWKIYDIILFLIVICAAYSFSSWKNLLILITLFTLGHTISMLLTSYNVISVSGKVIQFLIPISILVTALFNLFTAGKEKKFEKSGIFYIIATFFGLIHGLGCASSFASVKFLPILEYALGIEAGQIIAVFVILIIGFIFQTIFRFNKRDWVLVVSSIVIGMIIPMLFNRWLF